MKIPMIGKRIIKSAVGIALCYMIYLARGRQGIVFYSQLAVLWCIQPYVDNSIKNGVQRTIGTMIGAAYGVLVIVLDIHLFPGFFSQDIHYYLLVSFMTIPVIYTTVLIRRKNASYFSAVVFLSIVVNHITDTNPFLFVLNRVVDTMIGIGLGVCINLVRIPRRKEKDILFISGVDDTLLASDETLSDYNLIELNRMLDEGAQFTISTMRTPASVIDVLDGIHWKLPMIVMDGAALYDMKKHRFLEKIPLEQELVKEIRHFFRQRGKNCFINVVLDETLVICYETLKNPAEQNLVESLGKSPYRNFIQMDLSESGMVLYFMALGEQEEMERIKEALTKQSWYSRIRIAYYPSTTYPGNMYLKIYHRMATRASMTERLKDHTKLTKTITFGSINSQYDIFIQNSNSNKVVKTLKRMYEPYFFQKKIAKFEK